MCSFFFSSRRRHTRYWRDWSSDVCSSDIATWTAFTDYIRNNNNVTWRNFDVRNPFGGLVGGFVELPFLAPGARDEDLEMRLEVGAELPEGAELLLDVPLELLERMRWRPQVLEFDPER